MNLTSKARRDLESYLVEVRRSLSGARGIDPEDVEEGIREHVAAELSSVGADPATAEAMADVLERLGPPSAWTEPDATAHDSARRNASGASDAFDGRAGFDRAAGFDNTAGPDDPADLDGAAGLAGRIELPPIALAASGVALILLDRAPLFGWALLVMGALTARLVVDAPSFRSETIAGKLVSLLWHTFAVAASVALLLLPATLVWAQSQVGGALEPFLLDRTIREGTTAAGTRPAGYWTLVGLLAAVLTGWWWLFIGVITRAATGRARLLAGPAAYLVSPRALRGLTLAAVALLAISALLGASSWLL